MNYARVAVNVSNLTGEFDYHLPDELAGQIGIGCLVTVPFGKQTVQGVVLDLIPVPAIADTKPILSLLDPLPVLTASQIALARWMAASSIHPLAAMINLMLPSGLAQQADVRYEATKDDGRKTDDRLLLSVVGQRLLDLLTERGSLRGRQIDRHFKNVDWRKSAQALARRGVLTSQSILPPPTVRPKFVRTAQLAVPPEQADAALPDLGKTEATQTRRQAALRFLLREPDAVNVSWVYAESGCNLTDLQELDERGLIVLRETEIWRDPLERVESRGVESSPGVELTPDQQNVWKLISDSFILPPSSFLLHGVTGSGKTELYIRATAESIRRGKSAIILVPEIALTPQTVHRFLARFPGQVGILHSRLSDGERYDTWRRARLGLLKVVIGPRSALFAPLPNVGLIVADECHDGSYYQSEPPFYNAVTAAQEYARLCGAVCILGSATPSIVQRYQASGSPLIFGENGESGRMATLLTLPHRIVNAEMPPVQVVDMREELKSGNRGIFSQLLVDALDDVLKKREQAILFLNRRGTATYVFCRDCGHVLKCPNCDTPLTYHVEGYKSQVESSQPANLQPSTYLLMCHRCGYQRQLPKTCPHCKGTQIRAYGLGSEKVEADVKALFPSARTLRWDWETTRTKDSHEIILSHFAAHRADVLIGTQMLAKGLDLPLVTLVGIVLADVGLNLPDPFAPERTFNLLTQVAGRAGRSSLGGRVVLQTFQPESAVIQAASRHDYAAFYQQELEQRRALGYPPFSRLVRLEYRSLDPVKAEAETKRIAEKLQQQLIIDDRRQTTLIGPAPCFFAKVNGWYRWQIILRGPEPVTLLRDLKLDKWRVEIDPISLL
jgi:primosomal protein N' (replication factor Y) (superfamily II helicase)